MSTAPVGYAEDEIDTAAPTRSARLKWVVVVDETLPIGRAVNAAVCVAAATGAQVAGLLGPAAQDGSGSEHPGLPWAGCTVLATTGEKLANARAKAVATDGLLVVDMPLSAQSNRVYDEYLAELATTSPADLKVSAVSIVGEQADVDAIVKRLSLLT